MFRTIFTITAAFAAFNAFSAPSKNMEAQISSVTQKNLKGDVIFENVKEGVHVKAHVTGLTPNSKHGFHVHEKGECAGPDYKSAGGHFNPGGVKHGGPDSKMAHLGDLGNLVADEKGEAHIDRIVPHKDASQAQLLTGKAVIIHSKSDDLKSQPAGASGDRIGCGLIKTI